MQTKEYLAGTIKADAKGNNYDGLFVLNEESEDRMGDIIEVAGWDLKNFNRNPIALFSHRRDSPVGTWVDTKVEGKRLIGKLKLAGTNLANMVRQLIQENVLRAVSVGFRPLDWEEMYEENTTAKGRKESRFLGYRVKAAELLEVSLVSIPAHPNALLLSKELGLSADDRKLIFAPSKRVGQLAESGKNFAVMTDARKALEAARATLEISL